MSGRSSQLDSAPAPRATLRAVCQLSREAAESWATTLSEGLEGAIAVSTFEDAHGGYTLAVDFDDGADDEPAARARIAVLLGQELADKFLFETVQARDWVAASLAGLRPVRAGRFVVHGSHDRAKVRPNRINIEIEAALAFGTGHHGTTRGCLLAFDALIKARRPRRALDVGTGTGVFALALAPLVREVIGVDAVPELLEHARREGAAFGNVTFAEADATQLPFTEASFELVSCARTLHHVRRPEVVIAELARVTGLGGRLLVVDQLAPADPLAALELDRFERVRDPSHTRLLPDGDLRDLFAANGLVLRRSQIDHEPRELERYLDLAACEGVRRDEARALAPARYTQEIGWYLLERAAPL